MSVSYAVGSHFITPRSDSAITWQNAASQSLFLTLDKKPFLPIPPSLCRHMALIAHHFELPAQPTLIAIPFLVVAVSGADRVPSIHT